MIVLLLLQLMGGMMLSPQRTFFPIYLQELGDSAVIISTLASARQIMGLLASLVGGSLSDVLGRKWTLLAGETRLCAGQPGLSRAQQDVDRHAVDRERVWPGPAHAGRTELLDRCSPNRPSGDAVRPVQLGLYRGRRAQQPCRRIPPGPRGLSARWGVRWQALAC